VIRAQFALVRLRSRHQTGHSVRDNHLRRDPSPVSTERLGNGFFANGSGKEYLRRCNSIETPDVREEGIRRLARALAAATH
jgi:hypothetical protein